MAKKHPVRVRSIKRSRAIDSVQDFWAGLERLTARFNDQSLSDELKYKQAHLNVDDLWSCYDAWDMLLQLTRSAMQRRDTALMRECFDFVECCEMTRNPKLILEPAFVKFWEHLHFEGSHKEHVRIVRLMPKNCREQYLGGHPGLED